MAEHDNEVEQRRKVRCQRKGVVTRHLGNLQRLIAEDDVEAVRARLSKLKVVFDECEELHFAYHELLIEDDDKTASDKWFDNVEQNYIKIVQSARDWMKGNDNTIDQSLNSDDPNPNKLDSNAMLVNL